VYLGHLPHGFYEKQIEKYMSQFGRVKAVKVSRSKKVIVITIKENSGKVSQGNKVTQKNSGKILWSNMVR
jgi:hypothetical protein